MRIYPLAWYHHISLAGGGDGEVPSKTRWRYNTMAIKHNGDDRLSKDTARGADQSSSQSNSGRYHLDPIGVRLEFDFWITYLYHTAFSIVRS